MRIVGHLAWVVFMTACWIFMAVTTEGFGWGVLIILAMLHLGIVTHRTWPTS